MNRTVRSACTVARTAALVVALGATASSTHPTVAPPPPVASPAPAVPAPRPVPHPDRQVGLPTHLDIAAIGVSEALHGVGLKPDGTMQTPAFGDAGWYEPGPRPGARGPAVIVAHVHGPDGDDVFARLARLAVGDVVSVRRTDGVARFVVDAVEQAPKSALPYDRIWSSTERPVLRLITCGGTPDPVTRAYPANTIVYAHERR